MAAYTYFFTGFPGFIATNLIKQIIHDEYDIDHMYLLILPTEKNKAEKELAKIVKNENITIEKITLVPGDITKPGLNLPSELQTLLQNKVTHVFHLAAIYDLAVPKPAAIEVNVNRTRHVNQWVQNLKNLKRYVYFSASYVAGTREGRIYENELEMGQSFKNHYESTKYEAECLVRKIIDKVPTTIIRPGIVVGHSKTGETIKFDGPYFLLNFLEAFKSMPFIPYMGLGRATGNFVPVDFIFKATIYLGHSDIGEGKTYQLTDPKPYRIKEIYRTMMKEYLGKEPKGMVPLSLAKATMAIPVLRKKAGVEKEALDYFSCKAEYDCSQTQKDLEGSGISCPDFKEVLPVMVEYFKKHKDDSTKQIQIK